MQARLIRCEFCGRESTVPETGVPFKCKKCRHEGTTFLREAQLAYIAIAKNSWHKGDSIQSATKLLRQNQRGIRKSEVRVYLVLNSTTVDDMGGFVYTRGFQPEEQTMQFECGAAGCKKKFNDLETAERHAHYGH